MADVFTILITLTIFLISILYYLSTRKYNYWKKKNIPHLKPTPLLGNYGEVILLKKSIAEVVDDICRAFPEEPLIGAFYGTEPVLLPQDPEVIKLIVTKDFYYFNGREVSAYNHKEPVALNVFATYGDDWKVLRQNLTPLFSSAKMRNMFHLIRKCSYAFEKLLDEETRIFKELEVRSLMARFTIECIGACAFGVDANTTGNDKNNPFAILGNSISNFTLIINIKRVIRSIWPSIFYGLGLKLVSNEINILKSMIAATFNQRENKPSGRHDFIDLILGWKQNHYIVGDSIRSTKTGEIHKVKLVADDELLLAQTFVFFAAGFETSATTLGFTLFELAKNEDIQIRVITEVDEYLTRHENKLNYDCVTELPYLDACIDEALRLYPVLGVITREVMEDYTLPNGVRLERGLRVHLPVNHLHHNAEYFPDPEEFRPERFFGAEKRNVQPYTYMPFGEGPRTCIGMRFAKMQMLAGLVIIFKKYRLELAHDMSKKIKFQPQSFLTRPKGGITVKFVEREGWQQRAFVME